MNLEQRVAALETMSATLVAQAAASKTSARRWRLTAITAGLAMVGAVGLAANQSRQVADVVTAEMIEIVNGDGDTVMELTSDPTGGLIRLMNSDGDIVGTFEVYETGGYLSIRNPGEEEMAVVRCDDFGGVFSINNAEGGRGASMEVDDVGGIFQIWDTESESIVAVMDVVDGNGRVLVTDPDREETNELVP